jgi:hypothetical protein
MFIHTLATYLRNIARAHNLGRFDDFLMRMTRTATWVDLGKARFDRPLKRGGVWYLYEHSSLTEDLDLWNDMKRMLEYVSGREKVLCVSNLNLLKFLPSKQYALRSDYQATGR